MTVKELSCNEREELKEKVRLQANEYYDFGLVPELTERQLEIIDTEDEVPDWLLNEIFAGVDFVREDFWCNVEKNEV